MSFFKLMRQISLILIPLALPVVLEMVLNSLLNLADTLMISRWVSAEALSGVGFANQISYFIIFVFTAFNTGAVAMISRSLGQNNFQRLRKIASDNLVLNSILSILAFFILYYSQTLLHSYKDLSPAALDAAIKYLKIIAFSMPALFISFSGAAILRGSQNTKTPMLITLIANIVNVGGNFVLILGLGFFPKMGVEGAAWATVVGRSVGAIMYIYILFFSSKNKFRLSGRNLHHLDLSILKKLGKISSLGALEQVFLHSSFIVLGLFVNTLSGANEAAFRLLANIEMLSVLPAIGLGIATGALLGEALGAKKIQHAFDIAYCATFWSILWGIISGYAFYLGGEHLLRLFVNDQDSTVISIAHRLMPFFAFNQPLLALSIGLTISLRSSGDIRNVLLFTILRVWGGIIPLSYFFIIHFKQGVKGVWQAEIAVLLLFNIFILYYLKRGSWTRIKLK